MQFWGGRIEPQDAIRQLFCDAAISVVENGRIWWGLSSSRITVERGEPAPGTPVHRAELQGRDGPAGDSIRSDPSCHRVPS
jgi:hypothetical protein